MRLGFAGSRQISDWVDCINFFLLSLAMLGLGERKGEKKVWDAGRWWVGVVGGRGGKMKKRWPVVGLIFLSFGVIFVWLSYSQMGVCSVIEIMG